MEKTESGKYTKTKVNVPNQGEVFILTPNMLQKLGISLGDIATAQPPETNVIPKDTEKKRKTKNKNKTKVSNSSESVLNKRDPQKELVNDNKPKVSDDKCSSSIPEKALTSRTSSNTSSRLSTSCDIISNVQETSIDINLIYSSDSVSNNVNSSDSSTSILETASLMKKSVFLSPSFSNTDFVNTFHDEISKGYSNDVSVVDQTDIDIQQKLQNISKPSKSLDSADSIPVLVDGIFKIQKTSETLHSECPVPAKDKFSEPDEDIPLSKLKISLQKTNNNIMPEKKILISYDNSTTNIQTQTSLNIEGKTSNEIIMVNKNIVPSNLDPVNYVEHSNDESNNDTIKTNKETSEILHDRSSESHDSLSIRELNGSVESKFNGEGQMKEVENDLHTEDVDHFDEEYTLNNNNINQEIAHDKVVMGSECLKKNSKITILSEEIIEYSHLKEIKIPHITNKLQLTPVSIETKVLKDTSCDVNNTKEMSEKPYVESDLNTDGKDSVSESRVKEIADYLSQILKKRNSRQRTHDDETLGTNSKRNNRKSSNCKLSNQGVEKPGGEESNEIQLLKHNIVKTYSHPHIIKTTKKVKINDYENKLDLKLSTVNIDCKDVFSESVEVIQGWCICSDFGKFDFYCENESYEHIHFWYRNNTASRPEIIYSICNEDGFNNDIPANLNETVESGTDEPECEVICWYNINDYEAEHINDKESSLPVDLNKKRLKKNRRDSFKDFLETKVNATSSSSDVTICNIKAKKDVEISIRNSSFHDIKRHTNKSTIDKCELDKPTSKDTSTPSQSDISSQYLISDTSNTVKQNITRSSSNVNPYSITRRKSKRLSSHETRTVFDSITNTTEDSSSSAPKTSPVIEVEKPVKHTRNSISADVFDIKTNNKESININANEKNSIKITEAPSTSTDKKSLIIDTEKPARRTRNSVSVEALNKKNNNDKLKDTTKSKMKSKKIKVDSYTTPNEKSHVVDIDRSVKRTRNSTSVEVPVNYEKAPSSTKKTLGNDKEKPEKQTQKSTTVEAVEKNMKNQHTKSIDAKIDETINKPRVTEIPSKKIPIIQAEKPVKRKRDSKSVEIQDNKSGNESQSEEWTSKTLKRTKVTEAPSTSVTESPIVNKDQPVKSSMGNMGVKELDETISANNKIEQSSKLKSNDENQTRFLEAPSISAKKESPVDKKRTRNSISVEAADNNNALSKSTDSKSSETRRMSQINPSTAYESDSLAQCVTQSSETVEIVVVLPNTASINKEFQEMEITESRNVEIPIKQEIKTEPVPRHNRDANSFDEPSVTGMAIPISNDLTTCGVCSEVVSNETWQQHLKSHNYLAWKATEQPLDLDDREEVKRYLLNISRVQGGLYCSKCGVMRKYPKTYLNHIDVCDGNTTLNLETSTASVLDTTQESVADTNGDNSLVRSKKAKRRKVVEQVKCGVCKEDVLNSNWVEHIRIKHQYMARRDGEIPLDEDDEEEVKNHLHNISKYNGGLICHHCGMNRRYVKVYLDHIKTCGGVKEVVNDKEYDPVEDTVLICGVCKMNVMKSVWYKHIQVEHKYMAWIEGEQPLNVDDPQEVIEHLQQIVKKTGQLYCWLCNEPRKLARIFLQHVNICESSGFTSKRAEQNPNLAEDQFECGVCHEIGDKGEWRDHAMSKHYNVAWMVGEPPINIRNIYAVDKYLKSYYAKRGSYVCKICGISRSSYYGFYAHVLLCGKSDEEIEELMNFCEICNKKYVCIYKNQHMAAHRDAEMRKEMRIREAEIKKEKKAQALENINGKRRAAEKAQKVLAELTSDDDDAEPFIKRRRISNSDDSLKMEDDDGNESESQESEVDSDLSDEENDTQLRNKKAPMPKIQRMPFKVENASRYLKQAYLDYQKYHMTDECLYNEWRHTQLKSLPEASKYIPKVNTSCKVKFDGGEWCTLNRFGSMKNSKSLVLFSGGCIQCMSWVPEDPVNDSNFYLSISTHRGSDIPRFNKDKVAVHPGLIQIWNFGELRSTPVFSLGIAHNFGTIWAMDWCPSGARDAIPSDCQDKTTLRLGLLAVACSSGDVYIISVPYPPDVNNGEMMIYEAHPVVELRRNHISKRKYQATSICWTPQKGHSTVLVGYADGTTALYDLNTKSPLLKDRSPDSNMTIIYPFLEKKAVNTPITALSVCSTLDCARAVGSMAVGGATGAGVWSGAPVAASLRTALAARAAAPAPHWPAHRLLAEIPVSGKVVNELDWWSGGRRLGPMCISAACARCGAAAVTAPPAVRVLRAHPAHPEVKKRNIATLQMVPINLKVPLKKMNDDNVIVLQPFMYKDAVEKYGLELKIVSKKERRSKACGELEQRADRFPLSEVTAAAFCPSDRYHHSLALASHAGIVFVISASNN